MIRFSNIAAGPETQEDMARDILDQVREVLPPESIESLTLTARLDELGLDSLGLMAVINRIEEHFGMRFPEEWLYDIETCQDVVACIIAKQTRRKPDFTLGSRPSQGQPAGKVEVASNGKIPPAAYDVSQFPECVAFEERLKLGVAAGLQNPFFRINQQVQTPEATIGGRPVVRYTSYDYLGLAAHPEVMAAAEAAIHRFGTSASASRLVGGEHVLLAELDQALARFWAPKPRSSFPAATARMPRCSRTCSVRKTSSSTTSWPTTASPRACSFHRPNTARLLTTTMRPSTACCTTSAGSTAGRWWPSKGSTAWTATIPICRNFSKSRCGTRLCSMSTRPTRWARWAGRAGESASISASIR